MGFPALCDFVAGEFNIRLQHFIFSFVYDVQPCEKDCTILQVMLVCQAIDHPSNKK